MEWQHARSNGGRRGSHDCPAPVESHGLTCRNRGQCIERDASTGCWEHEFHTFTRHIDVDQAALILQIPFDETDIRTGMLPEGQYMSGMFPGHVEKVFGPVCIP